MSDEAKQEVMGLGDEEEGQLKLTSKDNQEYEVSRKNAFISKLIKTSVDQGSSTDFFTKHDATSKPLVCPD